MGTEPCGACGDAVEDALARTVRLSVDRSEIDTQRLCPSCFAEWIARYKNEMTPDEPASPHESDDDSDIIVD